MTAVRRGPEWDMNILYDDLCEIRVPRVHQAIHDLERFVEEHADGQTAEQLFNRLDDIDTLVEVMLDYVEASQRALGYEDMALANAIRERRLIDKEVDNA